MMIGISMSLVQGDGAGAAVVPQAPNAFTAGQWSVAGANTAINVTISSLPYNGGSAITAVQYRLNGGSWVSSGGTGSFTISGLTNGTTYTVELRAVNAVGNGLDSDDKSATPATVPSAPTLALTPGDNQVSVAWTDGATGGSAITGHKLYRGTVSGSLSLLTASPGTSPYLDTTALNGTLYYYAILASNALGDGALSAEQSTTPGVEAPVISYAAGTFSNDNSNAGQWYRDDVAISGQTGSTYTYNAATDEGHWIGQRVGGVLSNVIVIEATNPVTTINFNQANGTQLGSYPGTPFTMWGGDSSNWTTESNAARGATQDVVPVRDTGSVEHFAQYTMTNAALSNSLLLYASDLNNFIRFEPQGEPDMWWLYARIGGSWSTMDAAGIVVAGSQAAGKTAGVYIRSGQYQVIIDGLPYKPGASFGAPGIQEDIWFDMPAMPDGTYVGLRRRDFAGSSTSDTLWYGSLTEQLSITSIETFMDGTDQKLRIYGEAAPGILNDAVILLTDSVTGMLITDWTSVAGAPGAGGGAFILESGVVPNGASVNVYVSDDTDREITTSEIVEVPAYDGLAHWGTNISTDDILWADVFVEWQGTPYSQFDSAYYPFIGINGYPTTFAGTASGKYLRKITLPQMPSARRYAITWDGDCLRTGDGSGTMRMENADAGTYPFTALVYSASINRIEFEVSILNKDVYLAFYSVGFNPADPVDNMQINDIGPATGSSTMSMAAPVAPVFTQAWTETMDAYGEIGAVSRLMNAMRTNDYWFYSSTDGLMDWKDPATHKYVPRSVADYRIVGGGTGGTVRFSAFEYVDDPATMATVLPYHPFGTYGNNVRVRVVSGGGGSPSITVNGTNNYDVTITLAAGGNTVDQIATLINGSSIAKTRINISTSSGSSSTTTVPTFGYTNLSGGYDGTQVQDTMLAILDDCNARGFRPWFTVPWYASADWVDGLINAVNTKLTNPACWPITVEVQNEPWNGQFGCVNIMAAWAIKEGLSNLGGVLNGYTYHKLAERSKTIWTQMKTEWGDNVKTSFNIQTGNTLLVEALQGITGVDAVTDEYAQAPYFIDGNATENMPDSSQDNEYFNLAVYGDGNSIYDRVREYKTAADLIISLGKKPTVYEGQQHDEGIPSEDMAVFIDRQTSDRMEWNISIWLAEMARINRAGTLYDLLFFGLSYRISSFGAWGLVQRLGDAWADSPKLRAFVRAIAGHFVAYAAPGPGYSTDPDLGYVMPMTGTLAVGSTATVTVPICYHTVSSELWLLLDGVETLKVKDIVQPLLGEAVPYTFIPGQSGKVPNFRLKLVDTLGRPSFIDIVTNNTSAIA